MGAVCKFGCSFCASAIALLARYASHFALRLSRFWRDTPLRLGYRAFGAIRLCGSAYRAFGAIRLALNQYAVQMVDLMLDDLCGPSREALDMADHLAILPAHLDILETLGLALSRQAQAAFFGFIAA